MPPKKKSYGDVAKPKVDPTADVSDQFLMMWSIQVLDTSEKSRQIADCDEQRKVFRTEDQPSIVRHVDNFTLWQSLISKIFVWHFLIEIRHIILVLKTVAKYQQNIHHYFSWQSFLNCMHSPHHSLSTWTEISVLSSTSFTGSWQSSWSRRDRQWET